MPSWALVTLILQSLLWISPASSILVNRTIDDQLGDSVTGVLPVYAPVDAWHQGSNCSGCHIGPSNVDTTQVFDGTWHDSTYDPGNPDRTISLNFTGSAVYVFNLVPNTVQFTTTLANVSFTLDGNYVGTYLHVPDNTSNILYRVPVYINTSLNNEDHSLVMRATGTNNSLILFDYLIYTAEQAISSSSTTPTGTASSSSSATPTSSPVHSAPVGAIVGGTVGGIALIAGLAVLAFFFLRRRNSEESRSVSLDAKPYDVRDPFGYGGRGYLDSPYGGSGSGGAGDGGGSGYSTPGYGASGYGYGYGLTGHASGPSDATVTPLLLPDSSATAFSRPSSKGKSVSMSDGIRDRQSSHMSAAPPTPQGLPAVSQHQADLAQRIHALEERMRGIPSPGATSADSNPRARPRALSGAGVRALQNELAALRGELAGLNAQLAGERRTVESPPQYDDVVGGDRRILH